MKIYLVLWGKLNFIGEIGEVILILVVVFIYGENWFVVVVEFV